VPAKRDKDCAEDNDDADLDESRPVLKIGTFASAPHVHNGDYGDHGHREDGFFERGERKNFREMFREGARKRGDGAAGNHEKKTPPVKKSGDAAESVANETVQAPGFRVCGGKFGVGEGTEERKNAANDPDEKRETDGAIQLAENQARCEKNS